ncbi:MAG: hypothetical protein ACI8YQ_000716 [Polaribacter sp.]|jgi:hypothetical protein
MKNFFLAIFGFACFLILFTCCGVMKKKQGIPTRPLSNYLILDSLVCIDLSENLKGFSSGDDEILLVVKIWKKSLPIFNINQEYIIFSKNHMTEEIEQRISIKETGPKTQFVITLLEQDTKLKSYELDSIVITSNSFMKFPKIDRVLLQKELGDDDLLDVTVVPLEGIKNHKSKKTKLHGIHLFDEYEYWLYWHLE